MGLLTNMNDKCAMLMSDASAYLGDIADYRQEV